MVTRRGVDMGLFLLLTACLHSLSADVSGRGFPAGKRPPCAADVDRPGPETVRPGDLVGRWVECWRDDGGDWYAEYTPDGKCSHEPVGGGPRLWGTWLVNECGFLSIRETGNGTDHVEWRVLLHAKTHDVFHAHTESLSMRRRPR